MLKIKSIYIILYVSLLNLGVSRGQQKALDWVRLCTEGNADASATGVIKDASGNIIVVGTFRNTVAFGHTTLETAGNLKIFVTKFDPSGNVLWACKYGTDHSGDDEYATRVGVDGNGNIYVSGYYYGNSTTIGSFTLYNVGSTSSCDGFIYMINPSGTVQWAYSLGNF